MNQSELEAKECNVNQTRENQHTTSLSVGFAYDWFNDNCIITNFLNQLPITEL